MSEKKKNMQKKKKFQERADERAELL